MLMALVMITTQVLAQKTQIQSAFSYLKYEQLDKAKEAIDLAVNHETTMNNEKAWYYRGLIYQSLYKNEKFPNLTTDPLGEALRSYDKAMEINPKYENAEDIITKKKLLVQQFSDLGYTEYNSKNYAGALKAYEGVINLSPGDTAIYFNAALCAERAGDKAKAKKYYDKLIDLQYNDAKIYQPYAQMLLADGDTTKALEVLKTGSTRFPGEKSILISQTNVYISAGKTTEALAAIDQAITKDPTNANLYFAQGTLNEKTNKMEAAGVSYKKAIENNPDYFDAYYNLGALYFNDGARMANAANNIKDNAKYAAAKSAFEAKFKEAQPFLEKALQLNPKDQSTLISLKQLYATINDTVNYERVKALLDGLNK